MGKIVIDYKGTVESINDLPVTGNALGDVYLVKQIGLQYFWSRSASSGYKADWRIVNGPELDPTISEFSYQLPYDELTPTDLLIVPEDRMLVEINIHVKTAFNGIGANIKIGTPIDDDAFFTTNESKIKFLDRFFSKIFKEEGSLTIRATLNSGTAPSTGLLIIQILLAFKP